MYSQPTSKCKRMAMNFRVGGNSATVRSDLSDGPETVIRAIT